MQNRGSCVTVPFGRLSPGTAAMATVLSLSLFVAGCGGAGGEDAKAGSQSVTPMDASLASAASASSPSPAASALQPTALPAASLPTASAKPQMTAVSHKAAAAASSVSLATGASVVPALNAAGQGGNPSTTSFNQQPQATANSLAASSGTQPAPTGDSATASEALAPPVKYSAAQAANGLTRLKDAIADMALPHEIPPAGVATNVGWKYKPAIAMGTEPYGSAIGSWWQGTRYPQWRGILTWFVIYPAEGGNPATNTAVEINGIELWYLSAKTKTWARIQSSALPTWGDAYSQNAVDRINSASIYKASAPTTMIFAPAANNIVHGGLGQAPTPWDSTTDRADIDALLAIVRHRLVLKNSAGVDDRAQARLVVEAGVDYYPWVGAKISDLGTGTYLPGAGLGRFLRATNGWRYSTFLARSKRITEAQMLQAPPPGLAY